MSPLRSATALQVPRGQRRSSLGWKACAAISRFAPLLVLILLTFGCAKSERPARDLSLYFTCDTHGRLVPCGCFTGQYGGLTRLKTVLDSEAPDDAIRVDVGDVIGGKEDYDVIQYAYLLQAYASMKFDTMNMGHREAALPAARLRELRTHSPVPLLSANLLDRTTGAPIVEPYRILRRGPYRIAVVGVMDSRGLSDVLGDGLAVEKMDSALSRLLPVLRPQVDLVVLLAFTDEASLSKLAQEFYEVDVILGGKVRQPAQKLQKENRSLISFVTNESRALGRLDLRLQGRSKVNVLGHEIRLLRDTIPEDESVQALAAAYRTQVRHTPLAIDSPEHLQENRVPGVHVVASFVGSEACLECHRSAAQVWRASGHAHAFRTLVKKKADADPKCVGCHTIGFGSPSGYRREFAGGKLTEVGCESCHGPGSLHVKQYHGDTSISFKFRPLGAGDCQKCHYGEFSRPFDWNEFWPLIRHGKEPKTTASTRPTPL